jgi:hypothetical protein
MKTILNNLKLILYTLLSSQLSLADINTQKINDGVNNSFNSVLRTLDGTQIGVRYLYTNVAGAETANKVQWRAKLNFTLTLSHQANGEPSWSLRSVGTSGSSYVSGWNDLAGEVKGKPINQVNSDFNIKNLWIEYNEDKITAQLGSLETVPKGFAPGFASLDSNGWIKGARLIKKQMKILGLDVDRVAISLGRIDDFSKPMIQNGWGAPNYYDITVEATPIDNLKIALSNSIFTGFKSQDDVDYAPRVYAEYNTTEIFKNVISSIAFDSRFHTKGEYPVQRVALALNKKIIDGPLKDWAGQIAFVWAGVEEMYAPIDMMYTPNKLGTNQGKQIAFKIDSPALAKPFEGNSELKFYVRARIGLGAENDKSEDNVRAEAGFTLTTVPPEANSHLFQSIEDDQKRIQRQLEHDQKHVDQYNNFIVN